MSSRWTQQFTIAAMAAAVMGLAACAATAPTPSPQEAAQTGLRETVRTLLANQAAGLTATVKGGGFVMAPIVVPLANGEVTLVPLTPELDRALAVLQKRWLDGKRAPLPADAYKTALAVLTAHRIAVAQAGGESLIRFAQTDQKGMFQFEGVPEGPWLLLADLRSSVSILLWAYPVTVQAGKEMPPVSLVDHNLLLEARLDQEVPSPPASDPAPQSTATDRGESSGQ